MPVTICTCAFLNCAISSCYINLHSLYLRLIFCPLPPPPSSFLISSSSLLFSTSSASSHILLLLFHLFFLYSFSYNLTEVQSKVDSKIGLLTHVYIHTQVDKFIYILISTFSSTNQYSFMFLSNKCEMLELKLNPCYFTEILCL